MELEGHVTGKMLGVGVISVHHRSQRGLQEGDIFLSYKTTDRQKLDMGHSEACLSTKKKQSFNPQARNSLRQEIRQLEKRLQDQVAVRSVLEKALGCTPVSGDITNEVTLPKPATELIKEITVLELEVVHLEQYLLSLYRQAFDQQISSISPSTKDESLKTPITSPKRGVEISRAEITSKRENSALQVDCPPTISPSDDCNGIGGAGLVDSGVHRCHSSLSQFSTLSTSTSPPANPLGRAVRTCYSQPLSMMEYAQNTSPNIISLAEHLGTRISDHVPETPDKLSEAIIKCISDIYCKLSDPALANHQLSSPTSSLSSMSAFSPKDHSEMWSPGLRKYSSLDERLDNPFHVQGLKEFNGPYSTMVEVQSICRDNKNLGDIEHMLQNFRSLISRLEEIDPRKMNHEEKLAFWINVHNALVMHAYLAYGIPQNNVKRLFILVKAAYNIGGHIVSADLIQNSILGCRMSRPGQWLRLLLSSKSKFKAGDDRQAYSIEHPEPLLHFALCSGSHSDPAIRVYTSKRVLHELETAKEEYIRATFGVRKDHKILLPKIVEYFAKDSGLSPAGVVEMIQKSLPQSLQKSIKKCQTSKSRKVIEWIPYNFAFRYLISKELVK